MIQENTVFVLGSGASAPYRFPEASKLMGFIYAKIESGPYLDHVEAATGVRVDEFKNMANDLRGAGLTSIDLWLERRSEYIPAGKICIAKEIIELEHPGNVMAPDQWYADLWNSYLLPDKGDKAEAIAANKVSFITFNYDRSLEHALMLMITKTFGLKIENAAPILNKIPIIHVYGQVGRLPWQPEDTSPIVRKYESNTSWQDAKEAAKGISIMTESGNNTKEFQRARVLLKSAARIYFIGFGYHDENMRRLIETGMHFADPEAIIAGTGYHLPGRIRHELESGQNALKRIVTLGKNDEDALAFMKRVVLRIKWHLRPSDFREFVKL